MSDSSTKACRRCCEPIAIGAQRCPKCQSWQGAGAYISANPMVVVSSLFGIVPLIMMFYLFWPGADYGKYREQIKVVDLRLMVNSDSTYNSVVTVGQIENNSPLKWKDVVIEVQYFDKDNALVASKTDRSMDMVLLPGTQHAFTMTSNRELPAERYVSQKVFIRDAKDYRKWP